MPAETPSDRRRRRRKGRSRHRPGTSPGTLVGDPSAPRAALRFIGFGPQGASEVVLPDAGALRAEMNRHPYFWLNIDGLEDAHALSTVGQILGLHPLALEDAQSEHQRAKVEVYETHLFLIARMPEPATDPAGRLETDQMGLFLGERFVVTVQARAGDCFDPVRARLRSEHSRLRSSGPDYLAYMLLDAIVDSYFPLLEGYGEQLEALEDQVLAAADRGGMARIHQVRRDLLTLRRAIWPMREGLSSLLREPHALIREATRVYLRDVSDHSVQLIDLLENYREIGSGLTDVYLSSVSNKMNEIMKVLTIISTIFIPLSFIAGVYGMNFDPDASPWNMPELRWRYGYPFALAIMGLTVGGLLVFFQRKGWLRRAPRDDNR